MTRSVATLTAMTLLLSPLPLSAQNEVREACMPDIQKYCSSELASFDRAQVRACLVKNIKKTSPTCQAAAKARRDAEQSQKTDK